MSLINYLINITKSGMKRFLGLITLANRSYSHDDYHTDATEVGYLPYIVGQNNIGSDGSQHKNFVSKSTLIYCTQDVDLIFNHTGNVMHTLLATTYKEFKHDITRIFYKYNSETGTLYIECEGVLPIEGRIGD